MRCERLAAYFKAGRPHAVVVMGLDECTYCENSVASIGCEVGCEVRRVVAERRKFSGRWVV
jgi:hypothetical protein